MHVSGIDEIAFLECPVGSLGIEKCFLRHCFIPWMLQGSLLSQLRTEIDETPSTGADDQYTLCAMIHIGLTRK